MTEEIQSEFSNDEYARGALTVRVPETIASVYLPRVVEKFHMDHPKVGLDFINCSDEQLREELNSGRIDLAFLLTDTVHIKEVNVKLLKTEPLGLVSAADHPLSNQGRIRMEDLSGRTLLLPKTD
ncbi:MAG: LysR family transcriptional regulator substrate-binding protein [Desulfobacter sp.]|nr:MAG: LysR family transcriptional regulator substrate-binding protein [Desulfobacter sp.]